MLGHFFYPRALCEERSDGGGYNDELGNSSVSSLGLVGG